MKKNNKINNQKVQALNAQLSSLLDEVKKVNREINKINKEARKEIEAIDSEVNDSITKIEQICSDLDQIEKETSDELDEFILQRVKDLVSEKTS